MLSELLDDNFLFAVLRACCLLLAACCFAACWAAVAAGVMFERQIKIRIGEKLGIGGDNSLRFCAPV